MTLRGCLALRAARSLRRVQTLRFEPGTGDAAPRVVVQCMNSAPEGPALSGARVLLAPAGGTAAAAALAGVMTRATLAGIMHARDPESRATAAAVQAALATVVPKKARHSPLLTVSHATHAGTHRRR